MKSKERKRNTPIATLIKKYINKKSGKVPESRKEIHMRLGSVSSDGVVRNNNNMRLGTISSDGTIRNNNNMRTGTAMVSMQNMLPCYSFLIYSENNHDYE